MKIEVNGDKFSEVYALVVVRMWLATETGHHGAHSREWSESYDKVKWSLYDNSKSWRRWSKFTTWLRLASRGVAEGSGAAAFLGNLRRFLGGRYARAR